MSVSLPKCQPHIQQKLETPVLIHWSHFINYLWLATHVWEPVCQRHELNRDYVGETTEGIIGSNGVTIYCDIKASFCHKIWFSGSPKVDTSVIAITGYPCKILTYHCSLSFRPRNPWESTHLPSQNQGLLYLHFQHRKKFTFGVFLPPSVCRSSPPSHTPFSCPAMCSPACWLREIPHLGPSFPILLGSKYLFLLNTPSGKCVSLVLGKQPDCMIHNVVWRWNNSPYFPNGSNDGKNELIDVNWIYNWQTFSQCNFGKEVISSRIRKQCLKSKVHIYPFHMWPSYGVLCISFKEWDSPTCTKMETL